MLTGRGVKTKRQVNNNGFSFVELLVSITILAILVVPLLNSFVTAARTNAKAKRVLEATTAGQNLVEQIYTTDTIFDNILENQMEHAVSRDTVVRIVLKLLKKKRIVLL